MSAMSRWVAIQGFLDLDFHRKPCKLLARTMISCTQFIINLGSSSHFGSDQPPYPESNQIPPPNSPMHKKTHAKLETKTQVLVSLSFNCLYIYMYIIIWIWRSKWGTNEPTNALSSLNHLLEGAVYRPSVPLLVGCIILSPGCPGTHKIHKKIPCFKAAFFLLKKRKKRKPIKLMVYHKNTTYNILQSGYPQVIPISSWYPPGIPRCPNR